MEQLTCPNSSWAEDLLVVVRVLSSEAPVHVQSKDILKFQFLNQNDNDNHRQIFLSYIEVFVK